MQPTVCFQYLYRDASNFKNGGAVTFANPNGTPVAELEARLKAALEDRMFFVADQVGIPEVFLWAPDADYDRDDPPPDLEAGQYVLNEDDHSWHEFSSLEAGNTPPSDHRTIEQFVVDMEAAQQAGWREFDPKKHRPSIERSAPARPRARKR